MKAKTRRPELNGPKPKAKAPQRQRPAGADKSRRRAAAAEPAPKITARLKRVLSLFPHVELAKICGVTRQGVHQWTDFPPKHALAVEKASGGKLSKEYLAPNFYPRPA